VAEDSLDQWLLSTDGGPAQVRDPNLRPKRQKKTSKTKANSSLQATRKVRIYPTAAQKDKLQRWFGTARWTYNRCLDLVNNKTCRPTMSGGLREAVVNDGNYANRDAWVLDCPRDIRAGAYNDLLEAYKSNFAKQRLNPQHKFEIHYRSRKDPQESIYIDKRAYRGNGIIYPSKFGKVPFRSSEPLPLHLQHDARLVRSYLDQYNICYSTDVKLDENQVQQERARIAAIDPGVRAPFTLYDPSGTLIEFGRGDIGQLYRLCHYLDQLRSKIDRLRQDAAKTKQQLHRTRWRMRKAWRRASRRLRSLVDELHKQVTHQLVRDYDVVLLPKLEVSRLVIKKARKINSKAARAMLTWSHFRFRQRLLWKCRTTGCKVAICGEAYTSMTCGKCGWLHPTLGGNKAFKCRRCGLHIDRDANGARNILLKNASRFGFGTSIESEAALGLTPSVVAQAAAVHGPRGLKLQQ
jgi:putative transposase